GAQPGAPAAFPDGVGWPGSGPADPRYGPGYDRLHDRHVGAGPFPPGQVRALRPLQQIVVRAAGGLRTAQPSPVAVQVQGAVAEIEIGRAACRERMHTPEVYVVLE